MIESISALDISRDNKQFVIASEGGHMKLFDLENDKEIYEFKNAHPGNFRTI